MKSVKWTLIFLFLFIMPFANAQDDVKENLSQQAANPLADLMSFPFQNNLNLNQGEFNRNTNVLNIQPVFPLADGRIITRTIFPIVRIPDYSNEEGKLASGLSDIVFTAFYAPAGQPFTWGVGPVLELPTGGELKGTRKWSAGPSVVALVQPGPWTFGVLANNVWSFAGDEDRSEVNRMLLNLFVVLQLGGGWYVNSAPILTADWTAESDDRWTVPVGAGGGKLVLLGGKLPLNLQTQVYYNVVRPGFGPEWQWRVQAVILLPKTIFAR